jgi:L,D-transpeptidase ErfK/SrfK
MGFPHLFAGSLWIKLRGAGKCEREVSVRVRHPSANLARAWICAYSMALLSPNVRGQTAPQPPQFVVHGTSRNCSSITQLDSALSTDYQAFFAGWSRQDYIDAAAWSQACAEFGWHIPGRPRLPLLEAQRDKALGTMGTGDESPMAAPGPSLKAPRPSSVAPLDAPTQPESTHQALELPADGSPVIGTNSTVTSHFKDTLFDIARMYGLGYEEIIRANPGVDIWLPGEGTRILLPNRRILPPGIREGIVVNLPEHRLYYFPKPGKNQRPVVMTYPVSIGKLGDSTPLGQTYISAKVEHPSWYPTQSIRKEHADRGELLPKVIGPGPDNPIGDFKMRLGFGDGTYEIHGTNKPITVGMASTHGCIGMYPEDLAALYAQITVGTPVRMINVPVKVAWSGGALLIEAHPAVDAPHENSKPTLDQLADVLRDSAQHATVAILWDRARDVLEKADGVIATVGTQR